MVSPRGLVSLAYSTHTKTSSAAAQQTMKKTSKLHAAYCHSAAILLLFACLQLCIQKGHAFCCRSKREWLTTGVVTDAPYTRQNSSLSFATMSSNKSRPNNQSTRRQSPHITWQYNNPSSERIPKITHVYSSSSSVADYSSSSEDDTTKTTSRSKLRQITGFSFTALRTTLRAATGISLTALRISIRAATGISLSGIISRTNRRMLEMLSPSLRYFVQPFLIAYYAPLLMIRYWLVGPSRQYVEDSRNGHERIVEGWRKAVEAAERASADGYWPVHLNDDGTITASLPPDINKVDLADGIVKSVLFPKI